MKKYFFLLLLIPLIHACSFSREAVVRNYYIMEYFPHTEKSDLFRTKPLNLSVRINDIIIPSIYNQREIVIRHSGPRITYSENDLWAMRLTEFLPGLITKRISVYGLFRFVSREFLDQRPDSEITLRINNIELFELGTDSKTASINMSFHFSESQGQNQFIEHTVNREQKIMDDKVETFVQTINEIILEETDAFLYKILRYYTQEPEPEIDLSESLPDSILLEIDETTDEGMGALLLPAISRADNEPPYKIYSQDGAEYDGVPGQSVSLPTGKYTLEYGSGSRRQLMIKENIQIYPRYKTIIQPDWSCLIVNIIDERQEVVKVPFEIFDSKDGMTYGIGVPARREYGEKQQIWMLEPGRYKITINNEPFNTYSNFTTVYLNEGEFQKITIVVATNADGTPGNLIGAGVLEKDEDAGAIGYWNFLSAFYGNASINSTNEKIRTEHETTLVFNAQFENKATYDNFPVNYTLRNLIELGTTRASDAGFRISNDDTYFRNTLILYFLENMGIYGRFDVETHLLNEYAYFSSPINYIKKDLDGKTVEEALQVKQVKTKTGFMPLTLKEGVGINVRAINTGRVNLNVRAGFGLRQDYYSNVHLFSEDEEIIGDVTYKIFKAQESIQKRGAEVSVIGNFQLPLNLTYYTNADFLFPFRSDEMATIEWENVLNLKLLKYISVDYRLRLRNKQDDTGKDYIVNRHALFLRINYFAR
ncbi:MAG TPA: hypothetical protein ENO01_01835 [Candidatus Marinimicrobia bacterium]|nr:hypothetical protein [Candidatus Neomarinimicrobiota bacterium]